jgi:polyisoprenoid-binding protein YceI
MPIMPGTYELGPATGSLRIETKRSGAAAKAGHDLVIEVRDWTGTLAFAQDGGQSSLVLSADSGSMEVLRGTGGIMELRDEDKAEIKKTLEEETLKPGPVKFKSTQVTSAGEGQPLEVTGELDMNGARHPLSFELEVGDDGSLTGTATVKQSDWGIKPYSGLFGTLKVRDEIQVTGTASLGSRAA